MPYHGFTPVTPRASSCRLVLPTMRAPAALAPARQAASRMAGTASLATARHPAVVGTPSMSIRSFTASRTPGPEASNRVMNVDIVLPFPSCAPAHHCYIPDPGKAATGGTGYKRWSGHRGGRWDRASLLPGAPTPQRQGE